MKTIFRFFSVLLMVGLLSPACQREEASPKAVESLKATEAPKAVDTDRSTSGARAGCYRFVIPSTIRFNYRKISPFNCTPQLSWICVRNGFVIKLPCYYIEFPDLGCIVCDPGILARKIPSYRFQDFRRIIPEILKQDQNSVVFPIAQNVVGLQFYEENRIINRQSFTLRNEIILTAEEQKALGVNGAKIQAGVYPVVHNAQNNTFNALVSVK